MNKRIFPTVIFFTWLLGLLWWTGGFQHFTTYSYAMYRAGETPRAMPNFQLMDFNSNPVNLSELSGNDKTRGKYILVDFMYLQCSSVCGILRSRLYDYKKELSPYLGKNLIMASISFDPQRDTPTILKETWKSLGAESNWLFASLQGNRDKIIDEMYKFGVVIIPLSNGDFNHTTMHYLIDPEGKLVEVIDPSRGKENALKSIKKYLNYI